MKPIKFPTPFLDQLTRVVPPGLQHQVRLGLATQKPTTFRVNLLKSSPEKILKEMEGAGIKCESAFSIPNAYLVKKGSANKIQKLKCYQEGEIYLQSLSSQIPALILDPKPGEQILDMAAAPGGKTCQIAMMMKNIGEIVAVEPENIRFEKLKFNLERQGVKNVQTLNMRGEKLEESFVGSFDRILLDAPCSSEGTFCLTEPRSFAHWSLEWVRKIGVLQKKLITVAAILLKPGGHLVYSTCALSLEENEEVIAFALQQFPELTMIDIPLKFPFLKPAFSPIIKARRIYPSETMEGFFVCLMKKRSFKYHFYR